MTETNQVEEQIKKWNAKWHPDILLREAEVRRLEFLELLMFTFKHTGSVDERKSLQALRPELVNLGKEVKPKLPRRLMNWFNPLRIIEKFGAITGKWISLPKYKMADFRKSMPAGLSREERGWNLDLVNQLSYMLALRNLPRELSKETAAAIFHGVPKLKISSKGEWTDAYHQIDIYVERGEMGRYYPIGYDLSFYKGLEIEKGEVAGINVKDLDDRMSKVDWAIDFSAGIAQVSSDAKENGLILKSVGDIVEDLNRLLSSRDPEARKVHDQLVANYFGNTPNSVLVQNMAEIERQFEHKIHIDLSLTSEYPLLPAEAGKLLSSGVINPSHEKQGQGTHWISTKGNGVDENGFQIISPIANSENFNLSYAAVQASITGFPEDGWEKGLFYLMKGLSVKAEVDLGGNTVERYVYADSIRQKIATDWMKNEASGLYKSDERLLSAVDQYVKIQQAPAMGLVNEPSETVKETPKVAQTSIFEEGQANLKTRNRENEWRLQEKMYNLGVHPGVAIEAMDMLETGEKKPIVLFDQQFGMDKAEIKVRFEHDPDLDWLKLNGFDMTVTFGDDRPPVSQRYFFNADVAGANYGTLEAYNMAAGRSVSVKREDNGGNRLVEAWSSLDLHGPLTPQGNHRILSTQFDLSQAIKDYSLRSELEKGLPTGVSLDDLVHQVKTGQEVKFPLKVKDVTEMYMLQVVPAEGKFSVTPVGGQKNQAKVHAGKGKDARVEQGNGGLQAEPAGVKRTK